MHEIYNSSQLSIILNSFANLVTKYMHEIYNQNNRQFNVLKYMHEIYNKSKEAEIQNILWQVNWVRDKLLLWNWIYLRDGLREMSIIHFYTVIMSNPIWYNDFGLIDSVSLQLIFNQNWLCRQPFSCLNALRKMVLVKFYIRELFLLFAISIVFIIWSGSLY